MSDYIPDCVPSSSIVIVIDSSGVIETAAAAARMRFLAASRHGASHTVAKGMALLDIELSSTARDKQTFEITESGLARTLLAELQLLAA